jgi:hypothetical protein
MDPGPISFTLLHRFTITRTVYFLAYYYCFSLDMLIPLFIANRWDWQPHRKLGAKYLVVLCAGSALLLVEDAPTRIVNGALAGVSLSWQASPSQIWLFPTGSTNLGFLLRENLLLCSSYLPLGVPNWVVILPASTSSNMEPAHNTQPRTLIPTYDEVVNLTGLL